MSLIVGAAAILAAPSAHAQLRIVTYNTTGAPRTGMDFVLRAMGEETVAGVQRPIDILLLQEQSRSAGLPETQAFVNLLNNSVYAGTGITYARGTLIGGGDDTQTIVYRTDTVTLMQETTVGTTSTSGQPRQTLRYKVKPFGYDDSAAFYLYNSHYKASQASDDPNNPIRREVEATAIRANSDALGQGIHAIYAGDHNFYDFTEANEPAFQTLISGGNGQAFDPLNLSTVNWHNNGSTLAIRKSHTQSPTTTSRFGGQVTGGLDDRFDFQLITGELQDNEGMSYISGTYRTFGNNGTTYNTDIDAGTNTYPFDGVTFTVADPRTELLTDLASVTDHLPVMADYQIPAKMQVQVASIPLSVTLGASIPIDVMIENIAPATAVNGADELDYVLSVTGDLLGGAIGIDPAMGGGHLEQIFLNTATAGLKTGMITVTSASQQASSALFTMPVSFTVIGQTYLAADFNEDGSVDADDLAAWSASFGLGAGALKSQGDANGDGAVDGADLVTWQRQLGSPPPATLASAAVPEPAGFVLALAAFASLAARRRTI